MAGDSNCDWAEISETKELKTIEWIVAMLGCALFVFVSRVPQLLVPFVGRSWLVKGIIPYSLQNIKVRQTDGLFDCSSIGNNGNIDSFSTYSRSN